MLFMLIYLEKDKRKSYIRYGWLTNIKAIMNPYIGLQPTKKANHTVCTL